jgi:hypothetical protein
MESLSTVSFDTIISYALLLSHGVA